jgi:hypothetical protein
MEKVNEKVTKVEIPKRKANHFFVFDNNAGKYNEVKYLSQTELAEGFRQVMPDCNIKVKKLMNHFSVTLCFLPEYLWSKLRYVEDNYKSIKDGSTLYSIVETNQDSTMIKLYDEITKLIPDKLVLEYLINELDETQHASWLVIRANNYLKTGKHYESTPIVDFPEYKR